MKLAFTCVFIALLNFTFYAQEPNHLYTSYENYLANKPIENANWTGQGIVKKKGTRLTMDGGAREILKTDVNAWGGTDEWGHLIRFGEEDMYYVIVGGAACMYWKRGFDSYWYTIENEKTVLRFGAGKVYYYVSKGTDGEITKLNEENLRLISGDNSIYACTQKLGEWYYQIDENSVLRIRDEVAKCFKDFNANH